MNEKKLTPMLQQYFDIKKEHQNAFLFFRLGDFYEMFGDDAIKAAKILGLTLTARHKGSENEIPMCGVPYHSAEKYITELVKAKYHVAICEQTSDPSLPGIVERKVVKIITPGTSVDESTQNAKKNHYLLCLVKEKQVYGVSLLDLSTGEFRLTEIKSVKALKDILFLLDPAEIVIGARSEFSELEDDLRDRAVSEFQLPYHQEASHVLKEHFGTSTLSGFGIEDFASGVQAAANLLAYVRETQKTSLDHIKSISLYRHLDVMLLDQSTVRNLELLTTARDFKFEGSLLSVIDQTLTRMGARKLRNWLLSPLTNLNKIQLRLNAVEELVHNTQLRNELQTELKNCYDLERLVGKIGCRSANGRDLNSLKNNLRQIPAFKLLLGSARSPLLQSICSQLDDLKELVQFLDTRLHPEPPIQLNEGNLIADGFNAELDELRSILKHGNEWILNYQQTLREQTGISTLKVKYNKVFNYYIEISKGQTNRVPAEFEVRQTLVNAQRYITPELKEFETKYLSAEDRIRALEYELFQELIDATLPHLSAIQENGSLIAVLDVLQSFAQQALHQHYCKPLVCEEKGIQLQEARHPVIEMVLKKKHQNYISNDCSLGSDQQIILLTGPNMAGKSSFLRQTALIVLLAQIGSFVPAQSAQIGIVDQIFTRVGASDDLSTGQSTFMIEMSEAANILNNATDRSLIIFDELGRGTSTYDGVSIAWAILEHLAHELKAMTLFATHYHELIAVAKDIPNARNSSIAVAEKNGEVVFLRKVVDGGIDRSYGIEVAKLAGLPKSVVSRAHNILTELEQDRLQEEQAIMGSQPTLFTPVQHNEASPHRRLISLVQAADLNVMTPIDAMNYLASLKKNYDLSASPRPD